MKKIFLAITLAALVGSQVQTAEARGGWPIAAGVLGGLFVGTAIGESISQPYYYSPQPYYYAPAPAYAYPAPVAAAPQVVYAQPPVVYSSPVIVAPPVLTFGFGFGRGYYGHGYYRGYYHGRW